MFLGFLWGQCNVQVHAASVRHMFIELMCISLQAKADPASSVTAEDGTATSVSAMTAQLEEMVALEDPYCGELVAKNITRAFVDPREEDAELRSWRI
jgi:hypothetical protein